MASPKYCKAVLAGLQKRGVSAAEVTRITGVTQAWLGMVLEGRASFADAQLAAIESATGMSAGQLALQSKADYDDSIAQVMDAWAGTMRFNHG